LLAITYRSNRLISINARPRILLLECASLNRGLNFSDPFGLCPLCGVAYGVFELGSSIYDGVDLAATAIRYARGRASGGELAVTAAGAGAGLFAFGGGYGRLARKAMESLDALSDAAKVADRGGLTKAGRALQKHGGRAGSPYPAARGAPGDINSAGQAIVDDILTSPGSKVSARHHARFGDVIEVRATDGRGVRYNAKREFIGFLDP